VFKKFKIAPLSPEARISLKVSNDTSLLYYTTTNSHLLDIETTLSPIVILEGNYLNVPS